MRRLLPKADLLPWVDTRFTPSELLTPTELKIMQQNIIINIRCIIETSNNFYYMANTISNAYI